MKKKKEPIQKPKEFASRPFGALKGVREETLAEPPRVPAPLPEPAVQPDDADLFLRAVGDVRRLNPAPAAPVASQKPVKRPDSPVDAEERRLFLEALGNLRLDVTFRNALPEEDEAARPVAVNRMRQVKRGAVRIDFQLDLHGLTKDDALQSLAVFVLGAWRRRQKAVLVITGKGNNSPGEPVLLGAVSGWLRDKGKGMVAEFGPAPRDMGGGGALVVFLKDSEQGLGT